MAAKKTKTSFTLSEDAVTLLKKISEQYGLSGASTVEFLIREKAKELSLKAD